ncbi:MAG: hypothetical protein ABEJ75_01915 [Candidatus Nanohaloarchaea archaeon]
MDWDGFDRIVARAELEEEPMYEDFESIVYDVLEAKEKERALTSGQLPEGFESEKIEDADFGFRAEKGYGQGYLEVEYTENSSDMFDRPDSSTVEVRANPFDYVFTEQWDQRR